MCDICSGQSNEPHEHDINCVFCGAKSSVIVMSNPTELPNGWYSAKSMDTKAYWTLCSTKCALGWAADKHRIRFDRKIDYVSTK